MSRLLCSIFLGLAIVGLPKTAWSQDGNENYSLTDPRLSLTMIDQSDRESFLSMEVDTEGNLFVGSREALIVYEPDGEGGFGEPIELYRFQPHSWIYGMLIRGDDLYVSTVTTLYLVPNGRVARENVTVQGILWGMPVGSHPAPTFGVHQGMHDIEWGPEGDLYLSFGDAQAGSVDFSRPDHWIHWHFYTPDGSAIPYNGSGGIIKLSPDMSEYEVYSHGLRNPCGLAIDNRWNLFTHDNDHESQPAGYVPGRMLHATPGIDFDWPRGWMLTKTPDRRDMIRTMVDQMGRTVPVGQGYYNESRLPEEYHDTVLLARWGLRSIETFTKWESGATFRAERNVLLQGGANARPVGVTTGPDGRIYAAICYMGSNDKSPVYRSDLIVIDAVDAPALPETINLTTAEPAKLYELLSARSWTLQQAAHVEILRRGGEVLAQSVSMLGTDGNNATLQRNLMYLAAAANTEEGQGLLRGLLSDENAEVREHAMRALAEYPERCETELFVNALADESFKVKLAAMTGLLHDDEVDLAPVVELACSDDTYLRQAAVRCLMYNGSFEALTALLESSNEKVRMAGVLALGRQLTTPAHDYIPHEDLELTRTYGNNVFVDRELLHLDQINRLGIYNMAKYWAVEPITDIQQQRFDALLGQLTDEDEVVRLEAARFLSYLRDDRAEPHLEEVWSNSSDARLASARPVPLTQAWMAGPFPDMHQNIDVRHAPEVEAVDLNATYVNLDEEEITWQEGSSNEGDFSETITRGEGHYSTYLYFHIECAQEQKMWMLLNTEGAAAVWQNGSAVHYKPRRRRRNTPNSTVKVTLERGTNTFLVRVATSTHPPACRVMLKSVEPLAVVIPSRDTASLAERLSGGTQGLTPEELQSFLNVDWDAALAEGDAVRGRQLFNSVGCAKCHATSPDLPVSGGPSLADAARRFTADYLVESVLAPSSQVADAFTSLTLQLADGRVVSGLSLGETATHLKLLQNDAERIEIPLDDIEAEQLSDVSVMPSGLVRTTDELRDILSYLLRPNESQGE